MWCKWWVRDPEGGELGECTHIEWERWDNGHAPSFLQWSMPRLLDVDILVQRHDIRRGVVTRIAHVEDAIRDSWRTAHQVDTQDEIAGWWGLLLAYFRGLVFIVLEDSRLLFDHESTPFMSIPRSHIRVVGRKENCSVDPLIVLSQLSLWHAWIWEGRISERSLLGS